VVRVTDKEQNESPRIEIEIATVLLGFLFILDSIILTMPSDVLTIIRNISISDYLFFPTMQFGDLFSLASLYCSFLLLLSIPLYLLHLKLKTRVILLIARNLLAVSMYLVAILIVLLNGSFMDRLIGMQTTVYMNPLTGLVLGISFIVTIIYILASWVWYFYSDLAIVKRFKSFISKYKAKTSKKPELGQNLRQLILKILSNRRHTRDSRMSERNQTKNESSAPNISKRNRLQGWIYYGISVAIMVFVVFVTFSIIRTFPDYVPISNADNLLQIWITTNGVLMGFVGIIFAQLLSSIMDQQNTLYQHMLEETDTTHFAGLKKILNYLEVRRVVLSVATAATLMFLAYSILLSMDGIARNSLLKPTDVYAVNGFMFGPLLYSILGIAFLMVSLALPLKPPLQDSLSG
jgi:hypothetical protein